LRRVFVRRWARSPAAHRNDAADLTSGADVTADRPGRPPGQAADRQASWPGSAG